jgi:hypothetical protein
MYLAQEPIARLLQSVKGATARQANLILGRTGEAFWQAESYDHWVRNESEWRRIAAYIENNPVKAGLVPRAEDYRWSSAAKPERSAETSLRTPDVAWGFLAGGENDSTQVRTEGCLHGVAHRGETGPCRSYSYRSFRRV